MNENEVKRSKFTILEKILGFLVLFLITFGVGHYLGVKDGNKDLQNSADALRVETAAYKNIAVIQAQVATSATQQLQTLQQAIRDARTRAAVEAPVPVLPEPTPVPVPGTPPTPR